MPVLSYEDFKKQTSSTTSPANSQPITGGNSTTTNKPMSYTDFSNPTIRNFKIQQKKVDQDSKDANSFIGLAKNTITGIPSTVGNSFLFSGVRDLWTGMVDGYKNAAGNVQDKSFNPNDWAKAGLNNYADTINSAGQRIVDSVDTVKDYHKNALEKGVAVGEAGIGVVNSLFTIITSPLAVLSKVPVLGQAVDKVTELFSALGNGASYLTTNNLIKNLPISQTTKDTISPIAGEIAALVTQIVAGDAITEGAFGKDAIKDKEGNVVKPRVPGLIDKLTEKTKQLTSHIANELKNQADPYRIPDKPEIPKVKVPTHEPQSDSTVLPNYKEPPKTSDGLSKEDIASLKKKGFDDATIAKMNDIAKAQKAPEVAPKTETTPTTESTPSTEQPSSTSQPLGTDTVKISKLSSDIAESIGQDFGDLPTYETSPNFMKDQATKAIDLFNTDPATFRDIAMGDKPAPTGIREGSIFIAAKKIATEQGDVQTLMDLAHSKLTSETSVLGQRIKSFDAGDTGHDPVKAIQEVEKARQEGIKGGKIKDKPVDIKSFSDFINKIKC